jgi:hypothetical protein
VRRRISEGAALRRHEGSERDGGGSARQIRWCMYEVHTLGEIRHERQISSSVSRSGVRGRMGVRRSYTHAS